MNHPWVMERAEALANAYRTKKPIEPLTDLGDLEIADAYAVQQELVAGWISSGQRVVGHKVGLTSAAMQRMLGVGEPDFGHLLDPMMLDETTPIDVDQFIAPRVEPEIAFVLGRTLRGPGVTVVDALRATEYVVPALELIDSRIADWKIKLADTIADNASSAAFVVGATPVPIADVDLRLLGCNLLRNGHVVATGAGGAVLGHPIRALVWLANVLGKYGTALEAGQVVLSGSCTQAIPIQPGDMFRAVFAGLGDVTAIFSTGGDRS